MLIDIIWSYEIKVRKRSISPIDDRRVKGYKGCEEVFLTNYFTEIIKCRQILFLFREKTENFLYLKEGGTGAHLFKAPALTTAVSYTMIERNFEAIDKTDHISSRNNDFWQEN